MNENTSPVHPTGFCSGHRDLNRRLSRHVLAFVLAHSAVGTVAAVMLARGTLAGCAPSRQGVTVPEPRYGKRDGA